MGNKDTSKAGKKQVVVPNTDTSQSEDKSTRSFIVWMIAIMVLVVLVGGGIIYWLGGLYVTQSNKNKAQDIEIGDLQTKQQNLVALKPNYDKIIAKGPNGLSDADYILLAMPTDKAYDELVAMLEKMGQASGVKITSVSQSAATTSGDSSASSGGATPYSFSVTLEGSYTAILEFLHKTENSARVINFSSMNISGNNGGDGNQATITMKTYYQPPANIAPTQEPLQ